jgi:site-specific recombinase XerD
LIQRVLTIPEKKARRAVVSCLTVKEQAALLKVPDRTTWIGRRDHALLATTLQVGLRVSELTALSWDDVALGGSAHVVIRGKGRKERCTPLTRHTASVLKTWMRECPHNAGDPVFPTYRHGPLGRHALEKLLDKYVAVASVACPSFTGKNVTPHTLRHTCAMRLLESGVDITVIALWLGHEHIRTTQIYLHGDLSLKESALARTAPAGTPVGRYRPADKLMAFLEGL